MNSIKIIATFMAMLAIISVATPQVNVFNLEFVNNKPFVQLNISAKADPLKFLFDTGASESFIAADLIGPEVEHEQLREKIIGNNMAGEPLTTSGRVYIIIHSRPRFYFPAWVMKRNFLGGYNGILGFDVMQALRMTIDIPSKRTVYSVVDSGAGTSG